MVQTHCSALLFVADIVFCWSREDRQLWDACGLSSTSAFRQEKLEKMLTTQAWPVYSSLTWCKQLNFFFFFKLNLLRRLFHSRSWIRAFSKGTFIIISISDSLSPGHGLIYIVNKSNYNAKIIAAVLKRCTKQMVSVNKQQDNQEMLT